jgi:Uma2 family endonuclease
LASPVVNHQRIIRKIFGKFIHWFDDKVCEPFTSPFDVTLHKGEKKENNINVVQPDILVICDQENINEEDRYMGTPDLVIEVLSKTNKNHDIIRKLELYRTTGIKEYWIVNPFSKEINVYTFSEEKINEIITFKDKGILKSAVFKKLQISLSDIF